MHACISSLNELQIRVVVLDSQLYIQYNKRYISYVKRSHVSITYLTLILNIKLVGRISNSEVNCAPFWCKP